jgi:protease-4
LGVALLLVACHGRDRVDDKRTEVEPGDDRLAVFDLSQPLLETLTGGGLLPTPASHTYAGFLGTLRDVKQNDHVKGLFLRFGSGTDNWAHVSELGREFKAVREAGRPVYCHADELNNATLWLAAASCDRIWLSPAGSVESIGIAGQNVYLKGLLDRFKVRAEFLHEGRYKSAAESLTRDGPSPEAEESLRFVLASMRSAWLDGIAAGRPDPKAREAAEHGPWFPKAAQAIGLIDEVGYESDARAALESKTKASAFVAADKAQRESHAASAIAEVVHAIAGGGASFDEPHVAILPAAGGISMAPSSAFEESGIVASRLIPLIRRLKHEDATKAVVLRIDSPGGDALASDLMHRELGKLRREKPVIVSFADVAASGGYYLATAADEIHAEAESVTGSIGVVGGKLDLSRLYERLGVVKESVSRGARSGLFSEASGFTAPERRAVERELGAIYDIFLRRVAEGRGLDPSAVERIAQGRIWSGAAARELGLVDRIGGPIESLARARRRSGIATFESPRLRVEPKRGSWARTLVRLAGA